MVVGGGGKVELLGAPAGRGGAGAAAGGPDCMVNLPVGNGNAGAAGFGTAGGMALGGGAAGPAIAELLNRSISGVGTAVGRGAGGGGTLRVNGGRLGAGMASVLPTALAGPVIEGGPGMEAGGLSEAGLMGGTIGTDFDPAGSRDLAGSGRPVDWVAGGATGEPGGRGASGKFTSTSAEDEADRCRGAAKMLSTPVGNGTRLWPARRVSK